MAFNSSQEKNSKALTIIGIVLCIILIPALVINCVLIIKSFVNKDEIPNIGGTMMFIVLSDSMHPEIKSGDIIVCKEIAPEDVDVNMVISFYDPASKGTAVVTHKIVEKIEEDGKLYFRTRGINNNSNDKILVPADRIIAQYTGIRFPWVGDIAMFMQTTVGLIVCVIVPIVLFVGYDVLRRRRYEKEQDDDVEALKAELEALRAAQTNTKEQSETVSAQTENTDVSKE